MVLFYNCMCIGNSFNVPFYARNLFKNGSLVAGQQAARMPSPLVSQQTMSAGSVLGSAIESALSQTQQLQQMQQMQQYGMMPSQTATTAAAAAAYSPAQMMGGAQLLQQPTQSTTALSTTPTASGLTPESILQAYSGVQGTYAQRKIFNYYSV